MNPRTPPNSEREKKMLQLWVDDEREPPDTSWVVARSPGAAIDVLRTGWVDVLSLDHDLGGFEDGYEVAVWVENHPEIAPMDLACLSANPVGRERIEAAFASARRRRTGIYTTSSTAQNVTLGAPND